MTPEDPPPPPLDATFRNGTITAFGVTVSFSLGFLSQWASSPGVWHSYDTPPALMIFVGVALQIRALALLLPIEGLRKKIYDKATKIYLVGLILTGLGVCAAVSFDALAPLFSGA
ncbi:hypothetical protein [Chenggangzhangella methanolivorans]|uniref:Uncharacterized protein n=1 Tax=Chenggangzhangella methanolivorans TaxID=1437009 RepID=A0A9E6R8H8_9HYPH|nr:hypothetical protein [Chenggangzhangella methanolivorans]QZN99441.1 hypothetical protein K6K41_22315 [Chenggangzhangella methanolivorans]